MYALFMYEGVRKFVVDMDNQVTISNVDGLIGVQKNSAQLFGGIPEQYIVFNNDPEKVFYWLKGLRVAEFENMKELPIKKKEEPTETKDEN